MNTPTTLHSDQKAIIKTLNRCIEICTDGEKSYAISAADARAPALKSLFQGKAKERADFVLALQAAIAKLGGFPENEGTVKGMLRRSLMEARLVLESRSDRVIIEEWARSEHAALNDYANSLLHAPRDAMPEEVRAMTQRQYATIESSLDEARSYLARPAHQSTLPA